MTGTGLRDQIRAFSHDDLVAVVVTLCAGTYPAVVRASVIAELARRAPEADASLVDRECTCCGDPILALPDEDEPVCTGCVPHSMYGD